MTAPEHLTTTEAAELLGVDPQTVRRWADDRKIRHVRLPSGQLRFTRADIDAALAPVEPTPVPSHTGTRT